MLKNKLKELLQKALISLKGKIKFPEFKFGFFNKIINSWWRLIAALFIIFIILYYPLGALISNKIDTFVEYEITAPQGQSATVNALSFLINREINQHLWTPNLPFFFPAVLLDNMPAFQSGIISAVGNITTSLSKRLDSSTLDGEEKLLVNAAKFLNYPPDIWMFSPQNKLIPAPSSTSQYRRGRKNLINYNKALSLGEIIFKPQAKDLEYILKRTAANLQNSSNVLDAHIRENSDSVFDFKADELFYYQQGKLYAYFIIFKSLGQDYKKVIIDADAYQNWIKLLSNLEKASQISPFIIRNAELDASFAPNHLMIIEAYTNKAIINLWSIIVQVQQISEKSS